MTKYRLLTDGELNELEKEFVQFLIVNGIDAQQWTAMKANDISTANKLIATFGDFVFESILHKANFIEIRKQNIIRLFKCEQENMVEVGLTIDDGCEGDFTDAQWVAQAMVNVPLHVKHYERKMPYKNTRALDMFALTQQGGVITDGALFDAIAGVAKQSK